MHDDARELLREVARLADQLGPALAPTGHRELLRSITEAARRLFGAAACSVALLTDDQQELVYSFASGAGAGDVEGMRMPSSEGIAGWVVNSGQAIAIEDVARDPRFARDVAEKTGYVPRSILAMPLETDQNVLGVISVLDRRVEGGEGARDMELLAVFARQAALAIEHSRVFSHLGRALLSSLARASDDGGLADALLEVAGEITGPAGELAELGAHFNELARAGPDERQAAVGLLGALAGYLRVRDRRR